MVLITGFFLVSVTPVCIMWILVGVTLQPEHGENFNGPFVVVFFNSLVQPFLYLGINKSLRGALSACCKSKSPDGSQKWWNRWYRDDKEGQVQRLLCIHAGSSISTMFPHSTVLLQFSPRILKHLVEACRVRLENPGQIKLAASIAYFVILILIYLYIHLILFGFVHDYYDYLPCELSVNLELFSKNLLNFPFQLVCHLGNRIIFTNVLFFVTSF